MNGDRGELALVMSGGGARAAYQVGLLRVLARHFPGLRIPILTGVSAGAINAAYLASHTEPFAEKVERIAELWSELRIQDVFKSDSWSLLKYVFEWSLRLLSGGHDIQSPRGLVDTSPLEGLLEGILGSRNRVLAGIEENLRSGALRAVAITASSYSTGQSITWVQGAGEIEWQRAHRISRSTILGVEHVMASSALPLFFPAIEVDGAWYGDGGIRLTAPISPAIHLGANRILAISTRYARTREEADRPAVVGYPPPAQVIGQILNAVFLDLFDGDALRIERINQLIEKLPPEERLGLKPVRFLLLRPSRDLGRLANEYEPKLPRVFRFLMRGLGTKETRSNDLLSLIMFQPDYLRALVEIGERDAEARRDELVAFVGEDGAG